MRHLGSDTGVAVNRADSAPSADGEEAGAFPLSLPQLGLWSCRAHGSGRQCQHLGAIFRDCRLQSTSLCSSALRGRVMEETEALRLCFGERAGQPQQWVLASLEIGHCQLSTCQASTSRTRLQSAG